MLNEQTLVLLINAGIAGVFAVFAIVLTKYFLDFLKGEREQREKIMAEATKAQTELLIQLAKLAGIIDDMKRDIDCVKKAHEAPRTRKQPGG